MVGACQAQKAAPAIFFLLSRRPAHVEGLQCVRRLTRLRNELSDADIGWVAVHRDPAVSKGGRSACGAERPIAPLAISWTFSRSEIV